LGARQRKRLTINKKEDKMKYFYILMISLFLLNGAKAQWVPQNSGITNNLRSVFFTNANTGFAVGDSGTILKTTDGGGDWIVQNSGTIENLYSVNFPNDSIGYVVGDAGIILKTTDGGINWIFHNTDTIYYLRSAFFTDANTGYVVGNKSIPYVQNGIILKTENGGINWTVCYESGVPVYGCSISSVFFTNANTGYATGFLGGTDWGPFIVKTVNAGLDWTSQWIGVNPSSVYFPDTATGYIVGGKVALAPAANILKTTNGGLDWTDQNFGTNVVFNSVYFTDVENGFIVGISGIILKTTNGGTDWSYLTSGTTQELNSVYFPVVDTGYTVGANSIILKTTNGGGPVGINDQHQNAITLTIYPNPTIDKVTMETPSTGFLSVLNLCGQQLLQQRIIEPKTTIDINELPNGVYVIKLIGENRVHIGKIIKK